MIRNFTPGHILRQNYNLKRCMHPYVHSSTIYNSKTWKRPKCPSKDKWNKKDAVYTHTHTHTHTRTQWNTIQPQRRMK